MVEGNRGDDSTRAAVDPKNKMIINQIMLKYRPIAPRPVTERSACLVMLKEKRSKRKYVRVKKKKKIMINDNNNNNKWMILDKVIDDPVEKASELISFNNITRFSPPVVVGSVYEGHVVESWIMIESVRKTCEDVSLLRWKDLEIDSCPGFISNGYDEVRWVNPAYKKMVDLSPEDGARPGQVLVWLRVKMEILSMVEYLQAYSCRVRVVYKYLEKKKQMTVPCDVWKIDSGRYAWRLDVKAALSLGTLN